MNLPIYFDIAMFVPASMLSYAKSVYNDNVDHLPHNCRDIDLQLEFEELTMQITVRYVDLIIRRIRDGKSVSMFYNNSHLDVEKIKQEISSMDNLEDYLKNANVALEGRFNILCLELVGE